MNPLEPIRALRAVIPLLLLILLRFGADGQDEEMEKEGEGFEWAEYVDLKGYVKSLNLARIPRSEIDGMATNNFFHNRLNFRGYPGDKVTLGLEARTRFFYGEMLKRDPAFGQRIQRYGQQFDMSELLIDESTVVMHSKLDRAWLRFSAGKWELSAGRQRINWGRNLVWNPNDLFNTYSFIDFDYEERPGSDALRVRYFPSMTSSAELAVRPAVDEAGSIDGEETDDWIAAGKYGFNVKQYDLQFIGGLYRTDLVLGTGWAGSIGNSGFKGEASYFHPKDAIGDTSGVISASVSADHMFRSSLYLHGSFLFNSEGSTENPVFARNPFQRQLSPKTLMPGKYNLFGQVAGDINPLLRGEFSTIWSPGSNALFLMPSLQYSIENNWDIGLFYQSFYIETTREFANIAHFGYLRLKWSF